jgi:hypothetical protein
MFSTRGMTNNHIWHLHGALGAVDRGKVLLVIAGGDFQPLIRLKPSFLTVVLNESTNFLCALIAWALADLPETRREGGLSKLICHSSAGNHRGRK